MNLAVFAATVNLKIILKDPKSIKPMNIQTMLAFKDLSSGEYSLFSQMISVGSDAYYIYKSSSKNFIYP